MNTNTEVIAVNPDEIKSAGGVIFFRFEGDVTLEKLTEKWAAEGLDAALLPSEVSAEKALKRAVDFRTHRAAGRTLLVRRLPDRTGWAVVEETGTGKDLKYEIILHMTLKDERPEVFHSVTNSDIVANQALSDAVMAQFHLERSVLRAADVSAWLIDMATKHKAVPLRDRGGIYFVPQSEIEVWQKISRAVECCSSHRLYKIPALKSADAVRAVLDAVMAEAESRAAAIEEELATPEGLGKRALDNRVSACEETKKMLATYEELLGVKLDGIRERLERVRADLTTARLSADEDKAAA